MKTVRLTMAQALVRFLENQYIEVDGVQNRFVRGVFIIPGHGNVVGFGQALTQEAKHLEGDPWLKTRIDDEEHEWLWKSDANEHIYQG